MGIFAASQNRRLLFSSYLIIVGGLIVMAIVLDFGFSRLQEPAVPPSRPWVDGNLTLIEARLGDLPAAQWPAAAAALEGELGFPVRILPADHVIQTGAPAGDTREVFDTDGRPVFLRTSGALNAVIQIGPAAGTAPGESALVAWVPPLFYLSVFVLVGLWLWPLIRDLTLLTESAREFAADYRRPIRTLEKTTSLRDLARSLDEMSSRIRDLIQGQKDLSSALSHEMRTPLARIKFAMAVIEDREHAPEELRSINMDVQEIEHLINAMLDYARLDHPDTEINRQLTPADAWLSQAVGKCRVPDREVQIDAEAPAQRVSMDPDLMELALSNLLVNACRYAHKLVLVVLSVGPTGYRLSVEDDGPGIPEAQREAVFKAFTRLDHSRNRNTGGYGLGLAIVSRVAALHGGSVRAERSELGGARIVLAWRD